MPYKKAVILGAAGFIGVNLSHALVELGYEVVCFDRVPSPGWPGIAQPIVGEFEAMPAELLQVLEQAVVFHLVSSCRPFPDTIHAADEVDHDLKTAIRYLEACKTKCLRWVFVSSGGTIYGNANTVMIGEAESPRPICSYGAVKLAIEQYFSLYGRLHGTDYVIARLANPYGPWQRPMSGQGIIATLIYKAQQGEQIEVWGDGENVRDYIYIADAVAGLIAAATVKSGEVYNIGTGIGTSINQLIKLIGDSQGISIPVVYKESRSVDVRRNVLDASKLSSSSGWHPQIDLVAGIGKSALWIKDHMEGMN